MAKYRTKPEYVDIDKCKDNMYLVKNLDGSKKLISKEELEKEYDFICK